DVKRFVYHRRNGICLDHVPDAECGNRCQNGEDDSEPFLFHPSLEDIHRTSCHPPPSVLMRYFTERTASEYFVAIPKTPVSHIQSTAPGPPAAMAVATPTMFPVPMVAANAVVNAPNWLMSP